MAGTIPDSANLITEKYLDNFITSHKKPAYISNVPKIASQFQNPPADLLIDSKVEYMPHTSLEISHILTPETIMRKPFRENLRIYLFVILAAIKFKKKLGRQAQVGSSCKLVN